MIRRQALGNALASFAAAADLAIPAFAQTPTVKSLVANHGTIVSGDLTFSNFQTPSTLPYNFFGTLFPNDGSDIAVSASTMANGRVGLKFTPIDPATGFPKAWAVALASTGGGGSGGSGGGSGGGGGGGGAVLPTDVTRLVTYDVTVTNPNLLMDSVDVAYGPGTTATGVVGTETMTYYVDPVTAGPYLQVWDLYNGNFDSKSSNFNTTAQSFGGRIPLASTGAVMPGGYQRYLRNGVQIMMGRYFGLGTGQATLDSYSVGYTTVPVATPPVAAPAALVGFLVTSNLTTALHGVLQLNGPAGVNGADVTITSSAPNALSVPALVNVPAVAQGVNFPVTVNQQAADTAVTLTASYNGATVTVIMVVPAAPPPQPLALSSLSVPSVPATIPGGSPAQGVVSMNQIATGSPVIVQLSSSDPALTVPASVTIPVGSAFTTFAVPTSSVTALKSVNVTATYNGASLVSQAWLSPSVTVLSAEYWSISRKLFVTATNPVQNAVLTFGTDVAGPSLGTMSFSAWIWSGHTGMNTAPAQAVVWSSAGGFATKTVTVLNK